jgi:hypothetical protein
MSAKQLGRLAAVLLVLLVVWGAAALARRSEGASGKGDRFRLPPIAGSAVDTVVLTRARDTTVLARNGTTRWTVNGHPASGQAIADLLSVLSDSLPESELVAERRASQAGLGVDSAGGTRVRALGQGRVLADLVLGKRSSAASGGYLRRTDQEATYLVRGRLAEVLGRQGDEWRDHRITAIPPDSVAAVEISRGGRRYLLRRDGAKWTVSPGGAADSSRVAELLAAYRTVDAAGFASAAQADSARFSPPDRRARLLDKSRRPLITLLFDSTAAGFWIRPDTGRTVYQVDSYTADRLAPPDSGFRLRPVAKK